MSISLKLAKALGGDLSVTSIVNEGTTFSLRLPLAKNRIRRGFSRGPSLELDSVNLSIPEDDYTLDMVY